MPIYFASINKSKKTKIGRWFELALLRNAKQLSLLKKKVTEDIKAALGKIALLVLSVGFLGVGMLKLISYPSMHASFQRWNLPHWSMYVIGVLELTLSIALFYQPWRKWAMITTAILMVGAITIHLIAAEWSQLYGPTVVLFLLALLWSSEPSKP